MEISPFYDPLIAKLIAHGGDREQAIAHLRTMLSGSAVWPVKTNAAFLVKALDHPDFLSGQIDTGLIDRDGDAMAQPPKPAAAALAAAAAALVREENIPGFRLNAEAVRKSWFLLDGQAVEIELSGGSAAKPADFAFVTEQGMAWRLAPWRFDRTDSDVGADGSIVAPMPGKVISLEVATGDAVTKGQKLLTLEAMKMEYTLTAPFGGVVTRLGVVPGAQVQVEALLMRIDSEKE